ncbi:MAG: sodium:proton antiporter NhaD [Flavobacteriales bacterium]|nr:sodium:proton antiporter NhaD [Flavobacteriales bacterium]
METILVIIFVLGYLSITLEHKLKIDKLIPAIIMMALMWATVAFGLDGFSNWYDSHHQHLMEGFAAMAHDARMPILENTLLHHFGKTCEILIFLLGAMTIVEVTDHFNGFGAIKQFVRTRKKLTLLWIVSVLAFVLSSIIDNLTATIVLITILRKLIPDATDRKWFAGLIIIAANAGGAWSPIGDVTTTMLWIGNRVTTGKLIEHLVIPSIVCVLIPLAAASFMSVFKGNVEMPAADPNEKPASLGMLLLGLGAIVFVPIFKTLSHLPPYIGMMLALGVVAIVAEIRTSRNFHLTDGQGHHSPLHGALGKIEMPSILFFLGILMAVASLESVGALFHLAEGMNAAIPNTDIVVILLGAASAVIDNVPLVAASMGMFQFPIDHHIWHFIAFSAGTGGSMLIIGSAAGVVAMGMEKIEFMWYVKNIAWLAALGFLGGCLSFMALNAFVFGN